MVDPPPDFWTPSCYFFIRDDSLSSKGHVSQSVCHASHASHESHASHAGHAGHADHACNAGNAGHAGNAGNASDTVMQVV